MAKILEFPKMEKWSCLSCDTEFHIPKGKAQKDNWIVPCPTCKDVASTVLEDKWVRVEAK